MLSSTRRRVAPRKPGKENGLAPNLGIVENRVNGGAGGCHGAQARRRPRLAQSGPAFSERAMAQEGDTFFATTDVKWHQTGGMPQGSSPHLGGPARVVIPAS